MKVSKWIGAVIQWLCGRTFRKLGKDFDTATVRGEMAILRRMVKSADSYIYALERFKHESRLAPQRDAWVSLKIDRRECVTNGGEVKRLKAKNEYLYHKYYDARKLFWAMKKDDGCALHYSGINNWLYG